MLNVNALVGNVNELILEESFSCQQGLRNVNALVGNFGTEVGRGE